jgi:large subunit ribosomal protein L6
VSRIGSQPIKIPEGVTATENTATVTVIGPKGTISIRIHPKVDAKVDGQVISVTRKSDDPKHKSLHGLTRSLLANAVLGVREGWSKQLELAGVGYKASVGNEGLVLQVGFSHPVIIKAPNGITFIVKENKITVAGIDKQLVGEIAAQIRRVRPPEPYKGKGIHYIGEKLRKKPGKAVKAVGTGTGAK